MLCLGLLIVINIFILQKLDPLTSLLKASAQWEKRIHKSLNSMCTDLETSLAKIRPQSEQEELLEKWNELSTYTLGNPNIINAKMSSFVTLLSLNRWTDFDKF